MVPVANESRLRNLAWIEDNRRKVDQMTGGRVAYIYLPDTAIRRLHELQPLLLRPGRTRRRAIIDERFNGGGTAGRPISSSILQPHAAEPASRRAMATTSCTPQGAIFGPKVMIINEFAGSGGDAMPWYFRRAGVGPLVGKRTWGGLVGIGGYPPLMDGGAVTAPRVGFWNPNGKWDVENHGVAPDIEVELDPKALRQGHDPQLEKAVEVVMEELEKNPAPQLKRPAYPNYHLTEPRP